MKRGKLNDGHPRKFKPILHRTMRIYSIYSLLTLYKPYMYPLMTQANHTS